MDNVRLLLVQLGKCYAEGQIKLSGLSNVRKERVTIRSGKENCIYL